MLQLGCKLQPIIVYRTSWSYSSTQGELFIRDIVSSPLNTSLNEQQQRAGAAIEILRQKFGHIFCIEISPNDVTHFSSFRGGGDIHIYHQLRGGAVIMAPDSIPASELDEGGDSAEEGKTRCAAIEDKLTSLQKLRAWSTSYGRPECKHSEGDVYREVSVRYWRPEEDSMLWAVSRGSSPPNFIEKLCGFENGTLNFHELICIQPWPTLHAHANQAIYFIFQSLANTVLQALC